MTPSQEVRVSLDVKVGPILPGRAEIILSHRPLN